MALDLVSGGQWGDFSNNSKLLIDFKAADFKEKASKLDKTRPYLLHCRSGARSSRALKVMRDLGFKHVYHLDSGILGWKDAGQALVKGK